MMPVVETGRNPTMRYIGRTHGVSIAWLHERFKDKHHLMTYGESSKQAGDIFTKPCIDAAKWESVCDLIGVCHSSRLHALIRHFVATYGKLSLKPKPSADSEEDLAAPAITSWGNVGLPGLAVGACLLRPRPAVRVLLLRSGPVAILTFMANLVRPSLTDCAVSGRGCLKMNGQIPFFN